MSPDEEKAAKREEYSKLCEIQRAKELIRFAAARKATPDVASQNTLIANRSAWAALRRAENMGFVDALKEYAATYNITFGD